MRAREKKEYFQENPTISLHKKPQLYINYSDTNMRIINITCVRNYMLNLTEFYHLKYPSTIEKFMPQF